MTENNLVFETDALNTLTEREKSVVSLYASGKTRKEIADELFLLEGIVKNYINTVDNKLNITATPKQKHYALAGFFSKKPQRYAFRHY